MSRTSAAAEPVVPIRGSAAQFVGHPTRCAIRTVVSLLAYRRLTWCAAAKPKPPRPVVPVPGSAAQFVGHPTRCAVRTVVSLLAYRRLTWCAAAESMLSRHAILPRRGPSDQCGSLRSARVFPQGEQTAARRLYGNRAKDASPVALQHSS